MPLLNLQKRVFLRLLAFQLLLNLLLNAELLFGDLVRVSLITTHALGLVDF